MRHTDIDARIEKVAAKQYDAFSRKQAFDAGATERFVARRLASGDWARAAPAVYVLGGGVGSWIRQCKIAELSVDGSAIAGHSAAVLHKLPGFNPGPIELWTPINTPCKHSIATVHRYAGAKLTVVEGIRVTTVPQTAFDLAMRMSPWKVERLLDDSLVSKTATVSEYVERLQFYEGSRRPGLPTMRALINERTEDGWVPPESELEALLYSVLDRLPGRPRVERQAQMPWRSSESLRVDALLPDHNLIIEADGRRWHTRVKDFDRDQWRTNEAVAHGYGVMHFTWVHLHDFPEESARLIETRIRPSSVA